jgi:ubiquinone/menaquinone biosynthesis C-methylase UbiE
MPSLTDLKSVFNSDKYWVHYGDEWSRLWGGTHMQWFAGILPRIFRFIPADTILDIGAGQGRFAQFLKSYANRLILVDLSERCIEICKERFSEFKHIDYFVNDGKSLAMIEDDSVDFIFSHDALVFAEEPDVRMYVEQIARKMKSNGAAFIHHSNLADYWYYTRLSRSTINLLRKLKIIENDSWRAYSVSASKVRKMCQDAGLECIVQEIMPWSTRRTFVDCYSLIVHKNSVWSGKNKFFRNSEFELNKRYLRGLARYYHPDIPAYRSVSVTYDSLTEENNEQG